MNLSRDEQRVLHALAQGGCIRHFRDETTQDGKKGVRKGRITHIECVTRDGWLLSACSMGIFARLKRKRLIASSGGAPYKVTRKGLEAVRAQLDNR